MNDLTNGFCLGYLSENRVPREVLSNSFLGYAEKKNPKPSPKPSRVELFFLFQTWNCTSRAQTMGTSWPMKPPRSLCPSLMISWRRRWWWSSVTWGTMRMSPWQVFWTLSREYQLVLNSIWNAGVLPDVRALRPAFYSQPCAYCVLCFLNETGLVVSGGLKPAASYHCFVKGFCSQGVCAPLVQLLGCLPSQYWFSLLEVLFIFVPWVKCSWVFKTVILPQNIGMPCMCITAVAC